MTLRSAEEGLTRGECLALLDTAAMGRVALSVDALPVVLPVAFALLAEDVVLRPFFEVRLSRPGVSVVLAFQADHFDVVEQTGWSVLVQGLASEVVGPIEIRRCRELSLPVSGVLPDDSHFARIATTRLTGRKFASYDGWGRRSVGVA